MISAKHSSLLKPCVGVHSSRMSFDASTLTWEPTTVYHACKPLVEKPAIAVG
jgi:hypothetical protein